MKYIALAGFVLLAQPNLAAAQSFSDNPLAELLRNIIAFANTVLIPFIIGIGFLFFVWGMFQYFIAGGANEESREKGKRLMISATIAFVVIIIFFGVINLLASSTGLEGETLKNVPQVTLPK
jgi:heme/copper-type cytochrome/quinol oxidase subunit 2